MEFQMESQRGKSKPEAYDASSTLRENCLVRVRVTQSAVRMTQIRASGDVGALDSPSLKSKLNLKQWERGSPTWWVMSCQR